MLKSYYKETEGGRYTAELNVDCKKLIPRFAKVFKQLEAATISQLTDEATLLAISCELDGCYESFNEAEDWYYRLCPDAEKKLGKKRKRS